MREVQATFPIGTVLQGHYRVEVLLGNGPSGAVYLVSDQRAQDAGDQLFVIKQVIDLNTQERQRLLFEAVLLKQLPHKALPRVYHAFVDARHCEVHILLEYIEGPNLDTLRHQQPGKRISWPAAMTIMAPIVDAVGYLHRQQPPLIHGDIKAANIIVNTSTGAALVDRGFWREDDPGATLAAGRAGSSTYKAPAHIGQGNNIHTDIYRLGATFYTLLTSEVPADMSARLTAVSNDGTDPLKPADEVVPAVPAFVAQAIHRAMSLRADDCFSSVEQLWAGLQTQGRPFAPAPAKLPAFSRSSQAPRQAVAPPATVSPPTPRYALPSTQPSTTPPMVSKQTGHLATVSVRKPQRTPQASKLEPIPPEASRQATTYPATVSPRKSSRLARALGIETAPPPAPKPSRTPKVSKLEPAVPPEVSQSLEIETVLPEVTQGLEVEPAVPEAFQSLEVETVPPEAPQGLEVKPAMPEAPEDLEVETILPETPEGLEVEPAMPEAPEAPQGLEVEAVLPEVTQDLEVEPAVPETFQSLEVETMPPEAPQALEVETVLPETPEGLEIEPAVPEVPLALEVETVPPEVTQDLEVEPAVVPEAPLALEVETVPLEALQQAVEKPASAPAPKPLRTPPVLKLGSIRSIVRKKAAKKPVAVLQKHHSSSRRLMAGKVHKAKAVDKLNGVVKQNIKGKRKKARMPYFVAFALLLILLCTGSLFSLVEYQTYNARYRADMSLAREGIQHLQTGVALFEKLQQNPLDAFIVQKAQHEFTVSLMTFNQLDGDLKSLPGISQSIPTYGARLSAALHLMPIAIEVSQTGVIACNALDLLISRLHKPINAQEQGLTVADVSFIDRNLQQARTILNLVIGQVNHLQPEDLELDPRLRTFIATFHKDIPALQSWLNTVEKILPLAPTLLGIGTPTNYLIEVLDSTELRPGGGFIDSYGIATFSGGQIKSAPITDVDLLDNPFKAAGGQITIPAAYTWFDVAPTWSFSDSNLDADFPTAARYAELTYKQEGGKVPVQGVIAVTPTLMQYALAITGPIEVPEYHETITAQNLIARIHYYQLGTGKQGNNLTTSPGGQSQGHKRFIESLASHFLAHISQLSSSAPPKLLQLMINSLHTKDVQIYLNSSAAEHLLQSYHLDAAIQSPGGDGLFVVDANIGANKANSLITNALNDRVTIDGAGNVVHHTTLRYAWVLQGQNYGSSLYRDYLRVYVPPGSVLQRQDGWEPRGTSEAFGREVWAGFFTLSYRQTQTITLVWTVHGAVKKGTSGWHYQYTIQRPAGAQWKLHLQVTLPSCAKRINQLGGLVSGSPQAPQAMMLTQALNGDMNVGVDYTC
jgi:serine/threonine protein kinase